MKHFEVVVMVGGVPTRKGVVAADIVAAVNKAVGLVQGASASDVERAIYLGTIDAQ